MMEKQYDWFATRIFQPELSLDELFDQGITPENTGFKTRDDYRNMASVRDQFRTEDGGFDEDAFNNAYNSSREMYNLYTNREYSKKLLEEFAYDPYEWYAPATGEIIDVTASNTPTNNGMFYSTNIAGIGENTESPYSVREIAQQQLVHDENGNQLDWTPEDKGGLLKGMFRDPLVLATYDEDTPEYDAEGNLLAVHKKGEYKLNEWGAPYYEMLGDRDAYGKEMLHYTDTFTKEGSVLNKIDFYDSDGKRKSVFGTAMRTASQILPMFLHPAIGYTWGALNAAKGIGQSMAALGKGIDSIITGEDDNEFGRAMTKMENWLARFDNSKSDYAQTHMWSSAETYGDLIGSTTKQLFEQRLIANIPKQLKFLGTNIQRSKMGQNMAIAYMAATSAKESYQAGIEAGLGDRQAGLLLLANTAAMWKLMDSDYGRSTLFKGSWFDDDLGRKTAKETADFMVKSLDDAYSMEEINEQMAKYGTTRLVKKVDDAARGIGKAAGKNAGKNAGKKAGKDIAEEAVETTTKNMAQEGAEAGARVGTKEMAQAGNEMAEMTRWESSKAFLKKAYNEFSNNFKKKLDAFKGVEPEEYLSAMLREGVEEVAEEAIMDATKATTLALEALGVKMNDTGKKLDYGFSGKDIFDRYLLSFIGGAIGGGIFRGYSAYEQFRDNNWERVVPNYQRELIDMVAEGRGDEIIAEYKRLYDKGLLGSTELKASFKMTDDSGLDIAGDSDLSQADANLKILVGNVRFIEQVLNDEGIFDAIQKSKDPDIIRAKKAIWDSEDADYLTETQKRGRFMMLTRIGAHQLMTHDFIKLGEDFVTAKNWWEGVTKDLRTKDDLTEEERKILDDANATYEKRIKELRQKRDDILEGKYNGEYVSSILLETEGVLPKLFIPRLDKDTWALQVYGRTYDSLSGLYQKQIDEDLKIYFDKAHNFYGRNFAESHSGLKQLFFRLQELMKPEFEKQNEALKGKRINEFHSSNYFGENFFRSLDEEAKFRGIVIRLEREKAKLEAKEETPEIQAQIAELDRSIEETNNKIIAIQNRREQFVESKQNFVPMSMLVQQFKDKDETLQKLIDAYRATIESETSDAIKTNFSELLNQILSIYTQIKNDGGLVQDFGELKMAEKAMISFATHLQKNLFVFENIVNDVIREFNASSPDLVEGTLFDLNVDGSRSTFKTALDNFIKYLKDSKYEEALEEYNKMKSLVIKTIAASKTVEFENAFNEKNDLNHGGNYSLEEILDYVEYCFYVPNLKIGDVVENPFEIFFDITKSTASLIGTPFSKLLKDFQTKIGAETEASVTRYVENFFNEFTSSKDWTDFFIVNPDDQTNLTKVIELINTMETLLSMDNKTTEAMNEFLDDDRKLIVFDPISRRNLLKDLDALRNKIFVVLRTGLRNSGNRHEEIEKDYRIRTINDVQNLLKFWGGIDKEKRNKKFDPEEIWKKLIEESNSTNKDKLKNIKDADAGEFEGEQWNEIYALIRAFESKLFNQWSAFTEGLSDENKVAEFIKLFEANEEYFEEILLNKAQNPYDKHRSGGFTPVETFQYLLQIISVDGIELDRAYKAVLTSEAFMPSETMTPNIPNDEQERAVRMAVAYFNNRDFWNQVKRNLIGKLKSKSLTGENGKIASAIVNHKILNNTIIIPGACGVGKTTMVGLILKQLWGETRKTIFNAPKPETANNLAATFGLHEDNSIVINDEFGKEGLFKFLFGESATTKFDIIREKDTHKLKIDRSKYRFLDADEKLEELKQYEILIIDEVGQYNEIELELIDEIAQKAGILVIGLGDHCQIGDIIEHKGEEDDKVVSDNSNYRDLEVWTTPYLVRSMRSTSVSKATNNEKLGRSIYTIESVNYEPDRTISRMITENSVAGEPIEVRLTYSGKRVHGFCGDRITTSEDDFNEMWEHIVETKKPEDTVSIVIDSDEKKTEWTERIKKLNARDGEYIIKDIRKNEINGYETSYTIVDINWADRITSKGAKTVWKEFYTISQRSHYATLFLDKTDSLKDIHITSQFDKDAFRVWDNKPEFTRKRYESRMKLLEKYTPVTLFPPTDKLAKINHSAGSEDDDTSEEPTLPLPPAFGGSESTSTPTPESESESEPESEPEVDTLKEEQNRLKNRVANLFDELRNKGFIYDKDAGVNNPELNAIETLEIEDVNKNLERINGFLSEISDIFDVDDDVRSAIEEHTTEIRAYRDYLKDAKNKLENRLVELTKNDSDKAVELYTEFKDECNTLLDDAYTKNTTIAIKDLEQILNKTKDFKNLVATWSQETIDSVSNKIGIDLISHLDEITAKIEETITKLRENLKTLREEYQNKHVIKDSSDIDDIDLDALTPSQKTDLITRIDSLISEYQSLKDAIKDNERNDIDIKDLVENYERQLAERISKLKRIKNKLKTASVPVHNANYVQIKTQSENIRQDIDNKKINIRQAFDLVQATIRLAEDTLATDSTLTDDERATIENFRDDWKQWVLDNEHMLQAPESEKVQRTNEVQHTTGFSANQTTSERAALNVAETEAALQHTEGDLTIDDIVKNKFTEEGKRIYDDLVRRTANGQVITVWGLDLETTGTNVSTARIVQIGLVQYRISRNGDDWTVSTVQGSEVSDFVSPVKEAGSTTDDNMTPPEKLNGEDNPILGPWQRGTKIDERKALEKIFRTIGQSSDVITYNGFAYDMNVLRIRAAKLGITSASVIDSWKQIDVYREFINPTGKTGGKDLMWRIGVNGGKELVPHTSVSKLETFTKTIGRADTQDDYYGKPDWQLKVGKSHDARADVDATLNVMMNMFNGLNVYKNSQTVHTSQYESNLMDDDLYFKEVLLPEVKRLHATKYPDESVEELFETFATLRHQILKGEIEGDKIWRFDTATNRSTLYYVHKLTGDEIPLLVVNGERSGRYEGTFTYHKMDISKRASDDIDLLELRRRYPTIRISKPFVLTGVKYNEVGNLENLSEGAKQFYDPNGATHNLGKTFVLITEDPSFEDNWDPKLALSGTVREDGTIDWTSQKFEMLTVSRTANIQEMIEFSIASCALASDHILGGKGQYMKDFFDKWHKDGDDVKIAAGITLSNTQYERLYNGLSYSEGLKLYRSPVFSVMDSRKVGDFLAGFINGCAKNTDKIEGTLKIGESVAELGKPVDQWLFNNLIESIVKLPYSKLEKTYDQYYSLDVTINGKAFKVVCDGVTHNIHIFLKEPGLNIADEIANIKKSTKCLKTIEATRSNKASDLYDFFGTYFRNSKIGDTLFFDNISLKTTQLGKDGWEHEYDVFTSEVFTRTFTTWSDTLSQPVGLKGWDEIFEIIKDDVAGFTHGIFGHEIIDKSPDATMESSIFSMSICNNSLNGEYIARTARLRRYGYWQLNDDASEVDKFKKKVTDRIGQISKLYPNLKDKLDAQIEMLSENATNRGLSDDEIDTYITNEVNRLLRGMSDDKIMTIFVNSSGEFESKTKYKPVSELPDNLGYNKDYYWVNTEGDTKAYIIFEGDTPVEFCIETINTKDPYVVSFENDDYKTSLFKNLLLSLWDKNFKLNGLENYGYLRYFMHQVRAAKDGNGVGDVIISAVRECILSLPDAEKDKIFTKEIQEALIAADTDLENLIDSGLDFYEALDISDFDVFAVIEEICS